MDDLAAIPLASAGSILDALPDAVCILDQEGGVVWGNEIWRRFSAENGGSGSYLGVNYVSLCDRTEGCEAAEANTVGSGLRAVLSGREPRFEHVYACHAPTEQRWFSLAAVGLQEGVLVRHARVPQPREGMDSRARELLHRLAHELRTPLNAINGYAEMLDMGHAATDVERRSLFAQRICESSAFMAGLVDDMLEMAHSESGGLRLAESPLMLEDVVHGAVEMIGERAAGQGVTLCVEAEGADIPVLADGRRLRQVLVNLLSNAIKYSPADTVVRVWCSFNAGGGVDLAVRDQGAGMSEADLAEALRPYGRAESAAASNIPGLGLGLPLSEALVALHDGWLDLDSSPGAGTTATVRLPAWRVTARPPAA